MRKLSLISAMAILLFLVVAISHYTLDWQRFFLAWGALIVGICIVIIQLPKKQSKKKGYILRG